MVRCAEGVGEWEYHQSQLAVLRLQLPAQCKERVRKEWKEKGWGRKKKCWLSRRAQYWYIQYQRRGGDRENTESSKRLVLISEQVKSINSE